MFRSSNLIERSPIPLLFALALIACDTEAPPLDYDGPHVEGVTAGPAPWDPIHVDWADEVTDPAWASFVAEEPTPVVLDTDGREVELVPLEREVWDDASPGAPRPRRLRGRRPRRPELAP